ncbi:MAG: hypothetical protein EOO74_04155 [Myxococcales bacterium]|nr:MAG: hypothetical protein EOO74_04155 [Myxococcales bacterium]
MPTTFLHLVVLASPPSGRSVLAEMLRHLVAVLSALWAIAPSEPLQWRAAIALELAVPRVADREPVAMPDGGLASLHADLAGLLTALDFDAQGFGWWPELRTQLQLLLADLDAEIRFARQAS